MTTTPPLSGPRALLAGARLVPVLTIARVSDAVPLARALCAGGVRTLEITLRTARSKAGEPESSARSSVLSRSLNPASVSSAACKSCWLGSTLPVSTAAFATFL